MTVRLYHSDPYLVAFAATVTDVQGDWVALDRTAFYPGGGGQEADRGTMAGRPVIEVKQQGEEVLHRVPGHGLSVGEEVEGVVDWNRRSDLMRGHSGEHLLFSQLRKHRPDLELVKIAITPEKKSFMVRGSLDWETVERAERDVLDAIEQDLPISACEVTRDDPLLAAARVKMDRIHGETVRVVRIGDIDQAACAGIHIVRTGELGMVLVTKFTSAKPAADHEVEFEVGARAKARALELSTASLRAAEAVGSRPQDLLGALDNLMRERARQEAALRQYGAKALSELTPSIVKGVLLYSGLFESMDKKTLLDAAARLVDQGACCVLGATGERFMLVVACPVQVKVDCAAILNSTLGPLGGKGGGRPQFATGGLQDPAKAEEAMVAAIVSMRRALEES